MRWITIFFLLVMMGAGERSWGQDNQRDVLDNSLVMMELEKQGKYAEALPLAERALRQAIDNLGSEHSTVAIYMDHVGTLYGKLGQRGKAEFLLRKALRLRTQLFGPNHLSVAVSLTHLAMLHAEARHYAMAQHLFREAIRLRTLHLGASHGLVAVTFRYLAEVYEQEENFVESEANYRRALAMQPRLQGSAGEMRGKTLLGLSRLLQKTGRIGEAAALRLQAKTLLTPTP